MSTHEPMRIASPSELAFQVNANGSIRRIDHRDVIVNAFLGNEVEGGPTNLFLRRRGARIEWTPLLGPRSPGAVRLDERGLDIAGEWEGLRFRVSLRLAASAPAWFWHVAVENGGRRAEMIDLLYTQDLALMDYGAVRLNEYYISQYVDHTPLVHSAHGVMLAARQNLPVGGRHPWALIGSLAKASSFCTDALQFHGLAARAGGAPVGLDAESLPGARRQHEHALAVIQDAPVRLDPGARATLGFFGWIEPDRPGPSGMGDLAFADRALALPEATAPAAVPLADAGIPPAPTLFSARPLLDVVELDEAELHAFFGGERRAIEREADRLLSYFVGADTHVVLPAKERASLRPHGQILRTGNRLEPDEASLTTTQWMGGVFHSMLTQGHVSINRFLSTTHSYLGLFRSHGQRVFVEIDGGWHLLGVPSAFAMTPSGARWLYKHAGGVLEVCSWAAVDRHELWLSARVLEGPARRFLVSSHVALNGDDGSDARPARWTRDARGVRIATLPDTDVGRRFPDGGFRIDVADGTAFEQVGGDELLFADGRSRGQPFIVLVTAPSTSLGLRITGQLTMPEPETAPSAPDAQHAADAAAAQRFWRTVNGSLAIEAPGVADVANLDAIVPWFVRDACIHYLAPRGLEQYSGGGWGTRDVCQGPVELLQALGHGEPVRDILLRVFRNQNPDGDWPQWFMFFERERGIRAGDSHGDIAFWPILALAQYLLASDDTTLLDEELPFFHPEGEAKAERGTIVSHLDRALALIARRVVPGTRLAAYGNGDWNDSLQPVDHALAARLCSSWTVTLHHQTLATLEEALRAVGRDALAASVGTALAGIRDDFQRLLVVDGVVMGLAHFRDDGRIEPWLHPADRDTGIRGSLLPMIHGILANLFTREQAERHVAEIRRQLLAADGARLFDRPLPYHGGLQRRFQRAETSTFFGREIGLLYTHAHLRYAEAMAHLGDADAFFQALRQANPVGLRAAVPNARLRQANCYTSSSDAEFADRYDASTRYEAVRTGSVGVEGGWRVYSSGAGIAVRLVRERLLGLRLRRSSIGIDPVMPRALDGLRARVDIGGRSVEVRYRVGQRGYGPQSLACNGTPLPFTRESNPYRDGGALVAMEAFRKALRDGGNELVIDVG
jgi:1,2-beta-oligoglucan phosphorylase